MRSTPELDARTGLEKLATYPYQILTWVDDAGYPVSVAVDARINAGDLSVRFESPAGLSVPTDREVSLSITDPESVGGAIDRATIQGDARVIEEDPHGGWERLLPIWEKKEPSIVYFLKARVALPLFFERALIEITPRRVLFWSGGDTSAAPSVTSVGSEAA